MRQIQKVHKFTYSPPIFNRKTLQYKKIKEDFETERKYEVWVDRKDGRSKGGGVWYEDSVYYWWFKFLQLSEGYRQTCISKTNKNKQKLAVYKDFGNVFDMDFKTWWNDKIDGKITRGNYLFGVERIDSVYQTDTAINDENNFTITIPLSLSKKQIKAQFNSILKVKHSRGKGIKSAKEKLKVRYTPTTEKVVGLKKLHYFMDMKLKPINANRKLYEIWALCEEKNKDFKIKMDDMKSYTIDEYWRKYSSKYYKNANEIFDKIELGVF